MAGSGAGAGADADADFRATILGGFLMVLTEDPPRERRFDLERDLEGLAIILLQLKFSQANQSTQQTVASRWANLAAYFTLERFAATCPWSPSLSNDWGTVKKFVRLEMRCPIGT